MHVSPVSSGVLDHHIHIGSTGVTEAVCASTGVSHPDPGDAPGWNAPTVTTRPTPTSTSSERR